MNIICKTFGHWYRSLRILELTGRNRITKKLNRIQINEMKCMLCGIEIARCDEILSEEIKSFHDDLLFNTRLQEELQKQQN